MHQLLIAESSYERVKSDIPTEVEVVCMNRSGQFLLNGETLPNTTVQPTMIRLDWDLLQNEHMKAVVDIIRSTESLDFVQTSAAGLDNPLFRLVEQQAGCFCNSDAQAPPIAEFVVASVLNRWQRFDVRAANQQAKRWESNSFKEMLNSNWLIIGFGNIGQRIARQVKGFGASVTALRRGTDDAELADRVDTLANLHTHLSQADVVVLACALNDETRGMADASFFSRMKEDAVLVNIARGGLIEESALLQALENKQFDAAILDVFETEPLPNDHPFWSHDRVLVTPHSSNRGLGTLSRGDALFIDNLKRFLNDEPLRNVVSS